MARSGQTVLRRRLGVGAEVLGGGVGFRVWAPRRGRVEVVIDGGRGGELAREEGGYFAGVVEGVGAGARYGFRLDGSEKVYADPASRFQPEGPEGWSEVIDAGAFGWGDGGWRGISGEGQVIYEMHIGTFTAEGTFAAAGRGLEVLKELGVTCVEVMPVGEFAGRWGWGYDGVDLFAPYHHYGRPEDFRGFVDRAHALGLGVILDVVYNHFGPDGNYLREFSESYFSRTHMTDWGEAINFDGEGAGGTREFFVANAVHWIVEYHLDGFRFDATQAIVDESGEHILGVICREARGAAAAAGRGIYIVNENEPQETRLVRPVERGGYGMDALWNDDFHHSAMVSLSGHDEAYYTDYRGRAQEFVSAAKWGYLYQGQRYQWQGHRRGTPALDLPATAFVNFLQNHDQVANSGRGYRAHQVSAIGHYRAMTALLLLMPQTPMIFQGQEFAADSPFHYFSDHKSELQKLICAGRAKELSQFPSLATAEMRGCLVDPGDPETFFRSKIDLGQRHEEGMHKWVWELHRDLIRLRREDGVFRRVGRRGDVDGAVLGGEAFVLRYFGEKSEGDRLLVVNFGRDLSLDVAPEPLLAPPGGMRWGVILSTEDPRYGGTGTPAVDTEEEGWLIRGRCAVVMGAREAGEAEVRTRRCGAGSAQEAKLREGREGAGSS